MPEYPGKPLSGVNAAVVVGAAALAPSQHCLSIVLQARKGNTDDVFVGDKNSQDWEMVAGSTLTLGIDNPSDLFVKSLSGTQTISFIMEI